MREEKEERQEGGEEALLSCVTFMLCMAEGKGAHSKRATATITYHRALWRQRTHAGCACLTVARRLPR